MPENFEVIIHFATFETFAFTIILNLPIFLFEGNLPERQLQPIHLLIINIILDAINTLSQVIILHQVTLSELGQFFYSWFAVSQQKQIQRGCRYNNWQLMDRELFEDRFKVDKIDPDNKTPFRNVSRVHLISYSDKQNRRFIELDINVQIYPVFINDSFLIRVTDCNNIKNLYSHQDLNKPSERDSYEYVMYGVVFDMEEKTNELTVYISFGGLLMRVSGSAEAMSSFRKEGKESRVYLMMKRA